MSRHSYLDPPEVDGEDSKPEKSSRRRSFWREMVILILIALGLAFFMKTFLVQAFYIPSRSMENTLQVGDRVMVNKLAYVLGDIHRGDLVVFHGGDSWDQAVETADSGNVFTDTLRPVAGAFGFTPGGEKDYIKRVIGLPGDHVQCCDDGRMTVNGVPLDEPYVFPGNAPSDQPFEVTVPEDRIWVMGDHRAASRDSRAYDDEPGGGAIPIESVIGRAFVVVWPASEAGLLTRPGTIDNEEIDAAG